MNLTSFTQVKTPERGVLQPEAQRVIASVKSYLPEARPEAAYNSADFRKLDADTYERKSFGYYEDLTTANIRKFIFKPDSDELQSGAQKIEDRSHGRRGDEWKFTEKDGVKQYTHRKYDIQEKSYYVANGGENRSVPGHYFDKSEIVTVYPDESASFQVVSHPESSIGHWYRSGGNAALGSLALVGSFVGGLVALSMLR